MIRENRYLVLKNKDISKYLTDAQKEELGVLVSKIEEGRSLEGKEANQYVVVASDWPMYETVWRMIEEFVEGTFMKAVSCLDEDIITLEGEEIIWTRKGSLIVRRLNYGAEGVLINKVNHLNIEINKLLESKADLKAKCESLVNTLQICDKKFDDILEMVNRLKKHERIVNEKLD